MTRKGLIKLVNAISIGLLVSLAGVVGLLLLAGRPARSSTISETNPPPQAKGSKDTAAALPPPAGSDEMRLTQAFADQDKRIADELETLKERATAQQTLITSLATLTGIYVVVLSIAAYLRLQQTKDDFDALDRRFEEGKARIDGLIGEVRADIPAMQGIGRKLEQLLAQLDQRLPVDGDWTDRRTYQKLGPERIQQALIDEMVISSLEIFNVTADSKTQRTVSRLYVRVGQFYFARAAYLRRQEIESKAPRTFEPSNPDCAIGCLMRARLYFQHAIDVDERDPIALRALGVSLTHDAIWRKEDDSAASLDASRVAAATNCFDRCLAIDPAEPGACLGKAYLISRGGIQGWRDAIALLTIAIEDREAASPRQRRKFMSTIYLNRANYRSQLLEHLKATKGGAQNATSLSEILQDLRDAKREADLANDPDAYRQALRPEIDAGGDLVSVYAERKAEIDQLLTT